MRWQGAAVHGAVSRKGPCGTEKSSFRIYKLTFRSERLSSSDRIRMMEDYWGKYQQRDDAETINQTRVQSSQPAMKPYVSDLDGEHGNHRTESSVPPPMAHQNLRTDQYDDDHPALSLPTLLRQFGPLIFPLYRAALLRKRILLVGEPPVQQSCNYGMAFPMRTLQFWLFRSITNLRQCTICPFCR